MTNRITPVRTGYSTYDDSTDFGLPFAIETLVKIANQSPQTTYDANNNPIGLDVGSGVIAPIDQSGVYNAQSLVNWSAALGKMRNGVRNAKLLIIGDSTEAGAGSTGAAGYQAGGRVQNRAVRLATEMNKSYEAANAHAAWGDNNLASTAALSIFDTRFVFGAGWSVQNLDGGGIGGNSLTNKTTGSNISFTPTATGSYSANVDTFVVWYIQTTGGGTFSTAIDAGAASNVVTAGATSIQSATVTTTLAAHILKLAWVSGNVWILGIQAYDSTTKQVEVWQGGWDSATASTYNVSAQPWSYLNMVQTVAPDLTVIHLQINDVQLATPLATFISGIQTLITKAKATGDCVLESGYPSSITYNAYTTLANQKLYRDALLSLAILNGIPFYDGWGKLISYEAQQAVSGGAMYADGLHPTGSLYAEEAYGLLNLLRRY